MTENTGAPEASIGDEILPEIIPPSQTTIDLIASRTSIFHDTVEELAIESDADLEKASTILGHIQAFRKEVDTDLGEPSRLQFRAYKAGRATLLKYDEPLAKDEKTVKDKVGAYVTDQKRKRDELAAEAERKAKAAAADTEERLATAERLEKVGDHEGADAVLSEPDTAPPVETYSAPKTRGMSIGEEWHAEITSMSELIMAAATGDVNALTILEDEKVIEAAAKRASKMAKGMMARLSVPGVRPFSKPRVGGRAGR